MANIVKGDALMLFIDGQSIAAATSHTLTINSNTIDIANKDLGFWGSSEIGNITWELTSENLYTTGAFAGLFDSMVNKTKVDVVFGVPADFNPNGLGPNKESWTAPTTNYYSGSVYITSLTANANTGENATFSVTLTGASPLVYNEV